MQTSRRLALLLAAALLAALHVASAATPEENLHALFDEAWAYRMEQFPVEASTLGDPHAPQTAGQWDHLAPADFDARQQKYQSFVKKLTEIDREKLPPADKLNFDLFDKQLSAQIEETLLGLQFLQINQLGGLQTDDQLADALTFAKIPDYEAWIARLQAFPAHADQVTALLREGLKRKLLLPKVLLKRIDPQLDQQIFTDPAKAIDSPFYRPFKTFPDTIPTADRDRLAAAAQLAITSQVIPAFQKFKTFFDQEYLPASPGKVGLGTLPNGQEIYNFLVRRHTTTDLTPEKIHQIGLAEVARLRAEMEKTQADAHFQGKLADFFTFLRTDPRFFLKTPGELLQRYQATAKQHDPLLPQLFHILPRLPYGVQPIPDLMAPDAPTAYYKEGSADGTRPGIFYVNLYHPETRPTWEIVPLSLHESVPGHHLQISLALEQIDLPQFRRHSDYTAFIEGWGLYSETLGYDLGLYHDPYDKMGQLTYEMWRAVRLVVDTGLHSQGWDRQKAIDYFKANTPRSELDITNEVDRYLAMPGQALAYKIGQMKISQLRTEAELALGPDFDLRDYHDLLMKMGGVPLDILERDVKAWIASKAKAGNISTIPR